MNTGKNKTLIEQGFLVLGLRRVALGIVSLWLIIFVPSAFSQASRDLPPPVANFTNVPAGSLVIAMDTTNQALVAPFNMKSYGLVNNLLQNGIPVMWAIRAGKTKDAVDFSATAQRIAPTATAAATYNFSAGPFIVHRDFAEIAKLRITAFANNVAVYQLTQDANVDVRYTLTGKPFIGVSSVNTAVHTAILTEASIPNFAVANVSTISATSCYSFYSEPHSSVTTGILGVKAFVQSGGNFMAQCLALETYENNINGRFQTTNGIVVNNIGNVLAYPSADLSFSQFIGALEPAPGGSEQDFSLIPGSTFQNSAHIHGNNVGAVTPTYAATASKLFSGAGGMVYYLGGHSYSGTTLPIINGRRMYLNAVLTPNTRPTSCALNFAGSLRTLSGTIYEDVNGDSVLSDAVARQSVNVRLYSDANNNGVVDTGDVYVAAAPTDISGSYSFQVSTAATGSNYLVAVDSKSVTPSAGYNGGGAQTNVWAEQTYGDDPSTVALDTDSRFGGRQGTVSDNFNSAATAPASNAYEHLARVSFGLFDVANVNFAFSFNVVTNTRSGDTADDDLGAVRTVQGGLRQFIQNANAVAGANEMRFVPANGVAANAGSYWQVSVTNILPQMTDALTTIDGAAYNFVNGTSRRDFNAGTLGAGGSVGVDSLSLSGVNRPELEIFDGGGIAIGLDLQADNLTVRNTAIYGFGTTPNSDSSANLRLGVNAFNALIQSNIIGASAVAFSDPGGATRSFGDNIRSLGADGGRIQNNLIGFSTGKGIGLESGSTGWTIENNEIRGNGFGSPQNDGVDFGSAGSTGNLLSGNLIIDNEGAGVDSNLSGGANTILNNTITGNGVGGSATADTAGIRLFGSNSLVERNRIFANYGAGVMVVSSGAANTITRNSIYANGTISDRSGGSASGQIGIDLLTASDNSRTGTTPFVTVNDAGDVDSGGNGLLNFPVLETAQITSGNFVLTGFAAPGATLEFFIAAPDASGFGEGQTYLLTLTEGAAEDTDTTTGSYASPFGGKNVGADTTNRFSFAVTVPPGVSNGAILTATATLGAATSEFSNTVTVDGAPPVIGLVKSVTPTGGEALPDTELTYTIDFANSGGQPAYSLVLIDPNPANATLRLNTSTDFKIGSVTSVLPTGLTGIVISYSDDNGVTFNYTPVSGGGGAPSGFDRNVTHIRWTFAGMFSNLVPNNTGSVSFVVRIR